MHLDEDTMKNLFLNPALKLIMAMALSGAMVITSVGRLPAVEPANEKQGLRKGPLANLPSPPGPHIEKIKALGDNEWVDLGSPSPDPKCGRATGRSWGAKMPYAADLGGAFLMGTGPHGFVKPNGYTDDDLWFLDLNAFRWICLWPGLNTKTFTQQAQQGEFRLNGEGQLVDSQGRLIPASAIQHAWGNVTYNPDQHRFAWQTRWTCGRYLIPPALDEGLKICQNLGANSKPSSPWFYDAATGLFDRYLVNALPPVANDEQPANQFLYIPSRKQYLFIGRGGVAFFDPAKRGWVDVAVKGPSIAGIDHAACYDPRRDRVYLGGGVYTYDAVKTPGDNFYIYDVKGATLGKPYPSGTFPQIFHSNSAFFNCDTVNDVAVVVVAADKRVYAYHPDTNTWTSPPLASSTPSGGYSYGNGFYSPQLNAYFFHFAGDGLDNGTVLAYRYKKATK